MELTKDWQLIASSSVLVQTLRVHVYARYTDQDIINNRHRVEYKAVGSHNSYITDKQGTWSVSGNGAEGAGGIVSNSGSWTTITGTQDLGMTAGWVYHDENGNCTITCSATLNAPNWGNVSRTASGTATLPHIDRTSPTVYMTINNIKTNSFQLSAYSDSSCDLVQYSLNNGNTWTDFNWQGQTISGLSTNTSYTVKVRLKKLSNQLYGYAEQTIKTLGGVLYIKVNNSWKKAIPYIKVNGVWKQALAYVKKDGNWKIGV